MSSTPIWITPHFHRAEFDQPARHGFAAIAYPTRFFPSLLALCEQLEIIRDVAAAPIVILSGYRSPAYNRVIGGVKHSQHLLGTAADIACPIRDALDLFALIHGMRLAGELTIGGLGHYPHFVHVDIRSGKYVTWYGKRRKV